MATLKTTPTTAPPGRANGQPDVRGMDRETLIDLYPPKLEPMAQGMKHLLHIFFMVDALNRWFKELKRNAAVMADCFIYYLDEDEGRRSISPDVCVAFDVVPDVIDGDLSYFVERIGKPPDFALEVASESTAGNDLYRKPGVYAHIGISQYWMFDTTGGDHYGFALQGFRLVNGAYEPIEMETLPDGSIRGHSDILGLDICWENGDLRLRDPVTGKYLESSDELADARRREAEGRRREAEGRRRAERQLAEERAARRGAERRLAALKEEIARLRGGRG